MSSPEYVERRRAARAARQRRIRRRRRIAAGVALALIAVPVAAFAAFGRGGGEEKVVAGRDGGWGAGKAKPAPGPALPTAAEQQRAVSRLVRLGRPIYCAGNQKRYVALTLDDGPSALTPQFNELLRETNTRVTFYIVGANMAADDLADYARESARIGAVADHTWTHARLTELGESDIESQVARTKTAIRATTRAPVLTFRPPYGAYSSTVTRIVSAHGMVNVLWSTDSRDWAGLGWQDVGENVLNGLEPGAIVLMHDTREESLKALRNIIIPELKRRRLTSVTVPELFALNPPSDEQVQADADAGTCLRGQYDNG